MGTQVAAPDGQIIQFPDGTDDNAVTSAMQRLYPPQINIPTDLTTEQRMQQPVVRPREDVMAGVYRAFPPAPAPPKPQGPGLRDVGIGAQEGLADLAGMLIRPSEVPGAGRGTRTASGKTLSQLSDEALMPAPEEIGARQSLGSQVLQGAGRTPFDIARYGLATAATGNPIAGMGAADMLTRSGPNATPQEALTAGAKGAAFGAAMGPLGEYGRAVKVPASAAIGAGMTALEGGSPKDIASSAITMGVLGGLHGKPDMGSPGEAGAAAPTAGDNAAPAEVAPPKPAPPAKVQRVSAATPNPPTAATPTAPESPETIAIQVQQLADADGATGRKAVMFPKGTPVPTQFPPVADGHQPISLYHDKFGNVYAYRPDLTSKAEISRAAANNGLSAILGGPDGMGAPDKAELHPPQVLDDLAIGLTQQTLRNGSIKAGRPFAKLTAAEQEQVRALADRIYPTSAVVARAPDGTEVQSTATNAASLPQTLAAAQDVTPPGGTVGIEPAQDVVAQRQGIRTPSPFGASEDEYVAKMMPEPHPGISDADWEAAIRTDRRKFLPQAPQPLAGKEADISAEQPPLAGAASPIEQAPQPPVGTEVVQNTPVAPTPEAGAAPMRAAVDSRSDDPGGFRAWQEKQRGAAPAVQPERLGIPSPSEPGALIRPNFIPPPPGHVVQMDPNALTLDPVQMQFKRDVGEKGVSDKFKDLTSYDPVAGGNIAVWYDPESGKTYAVDGHHRTELAQRTNAPWVNVTYLDAKTASEARTQGALLNIKTDNGTAIDAAKLFRDGGFTQDDLKQAGVTTRSPIARDGWALAKLDPSIWNLVWHGDISPEQGAVIGDMLEGRDADQKTVVDAIDQAAAKGKKIDPAELRESIRVGMRPEYDITTEGETDLWGNKTSERRSVFNEVGELSKYVQKQLSSEKRLFGTVASGADRLSREGNVLNTDANARISQDAAQAQAVYQKLSGMSGPVSDAIYQGARELAEGGNPNAVRQKTYEAVRAAVSETLTGRKAAGVDGAEIGNPGGPGTLSVPGGAGSDGAGEPSLFAPDAAAPNGSAEPARNFLKDESGTQTIGATTQAAGDRIAAMAREVQGALAPQTFSDLAQSAAGTFRETWGKLMQAQDRAKTTFEAFRGMFNKAPVVDGIHGVHVLHAIESGDLSGLTPEEAAFAAEAHGANEYRWMALRDRGILSPDAYIENYFKHFWKEPDQEAASKWAANWMQKRQMAGAESFRWERVYPTLADAFADPNFKLVPKYDNPVDMELATLAEMDKSITGHDAFKEFENQGVMKFVKEGQRPPDGYTLLDDKLFKRYLPRFGAVKLPSDALMAGMTPEEVEVYGRRPAGQYALPDDMARVALNAINRGWEGSPNYQAYMKVKGTWNALNLGFSTFHGATTALNSSFSDLALGIKAASEGRLSDAAKNAGTATVPFASVIRDYIKGTRLEALWDGRATDPNPQEIAVMDALKAAGGSPHQAQFNPDHFWNGLKDAISKHEPGWAVARAPLALAEQIGKPIMAKLVPRAKIGAFLNAVQAEIESHPDMDLFEQRQRFGKIWDSMDNRFGQLNQRNMFLDPAIRGVMNTVMGRPGWTVGSVRELAGGAYDIAKMPIDAATGKPIEISHRAAGLMAIVGGGMLMNGALTAIMTGTPPHGADFVAPRDGGKTLDGHPSRIIAPIYLSKDVLSWTSRPLQTAIAKLAQPIMVTSQLVRNRDFYDRKIWGRGGIGPLAYALGSLQPYALSGAEQNIQKGEGAKALLPFAGIMPASPSIGLSPTEKILRDASQERQANTRPAPTAQSRARSLVFQEAEKNGANAAHALGQQYVKKGMLKTAQIRETVKRAVDGPLVTDFRAAPLGTALEAYDKASPEERAKLQSVAHAKVLRARVNPSDWGDGDERDRNAALAFKYFGVKPVGIPSPTAIQ